MASTEQRWQFIYQTGILESQLKPDLEERAFRKSTSKGRYDAAHLAPFLFVSSKEVANLIHETRVLLFPPEPEGALPWGARRSHASSCWAWVGLTSLCLLGSPRSGRSTATTPGSAAPSVWFAALLSLGDAFEGVVLPVPGHHGTWGGSMSLAWLQAFFGPSVVVSVTAALCMGPAIVRLHLVHPGRRNNKGYLWVCTHTLMQSSLQHCEVIVESASYVFLMGCV